MYNIYLRIGTVKCTGPGFYLQAIGLNFLKKKSVFAVSPLLFVLVLWRRAVQLVEKDLGLSHFIVNTIYHVLALHFVYAHYRLHPKVEKNSFS